MSDDEAAPFVRLMKLVEKELELAESRRLRELQAAVTRTGAYMRTLPMPAPASAQATLQRVLGIRSRVAVEARRAQDELQAALDERQAARDAMRRTQQIARRYAPPRPDRYSTSV